MKRRPTPTYPADETLVYWLGRVARERRDAAGVTMVEIALLLGMNTTKGVERFERAEHWPSALEWTLAAYSEALDIDGRDLIVEAVDRWRTATDPPRLPGSDRLLVSGARLVAESVDGSVDGS